MARGATKARLRALRKKYRLGEFKKTRRKTSTAKRRKTAKRSAKRFQSAGVGIR